MDTKRHGRSSAAPAGLKASHKPLQRFWCHQCCQTFTTGRAATPKGSSFGSDVIDDAVTAYVEGMGSYRALARSYTRRLGVEVTARTINQWVLDAGARALTPLEVSQRLAPPDWGGWLGIDGKHLRIGSDDTAVLMIAVDQTTGDLVHATVVDVESGEAFASILTDVVLAGYPLQGIVADLGSGAPHMSFPTVCRHYFGNLPFQACRLHLLRRATDILSTPTDGTDTDSNRQLLAFIHQILFAATRSQADDAYYQLTRHEHRYTSRPARTILRSLRRTYNLHMTHHDHPGLPADTNITENVIRSLNRKIRPMEHFATATTADHYSRLLAANYRWKPFTDSNHGRNGRSPLQHAGVELPTQHWLDYLNQQH